MKFDLHVHTEHSKDSESSVDDVIEMAIKIGLDGLAFLDHNNMNAYHEADPSELIIVPAEEVSTPEGHVGALGMERSIGRQPDVRTAIMMIKDQGGLPVALHPYRFWSGIGEKEVRANDFAALEGHNARTCLKENRKAQSLAKVLGLPIIGGSDAHTVEQVGSAYTVVKDVSSWRQLLDEIRSGRTTVGGTHRSRTDTARYVKKAVSEWVGRGFKRM